MAPQKRVGSQCQAGRRSNALLVAFPVKGRLLGAGLLVRRAPLGLGHLPGTERPELGQYEGLRRAACPQLLRDDLRAAVGIDAVYVDGRAAFVDVVDALTVYDDGARTRSFCFVDDTVDGMIRLLHSKETTPVNMGNPDEMTILEFAHKVLALVGSESEITFVTPTDARTADDPKVRSPDISKAKHVLGWEPRASLEEGLGQTIECFRGKLGLA